MPISRSYSRTPTWQNQRPLVRTRSRILLSHLLFPHPKDQITIPNLTFMKHWFKSFPFPPNQIFLPTMLILNKSTHASALLLRTPKIKKPMTRRSLLCWYSLHAFTPGKLSYMSSRLALAVPAGNRWIDRGKPWICCFRTSLRFGCCVGAAIWEIMDTHTFGLSSSCGRRIGVWYCAGSMHIQRYGKRKRVCEQIRWYLSLQQNKTDLCSCNQNNEKKTCRHKKR
jgi:hypothetical protein